MQQRRWIDKRRRRRHWLPVRWLERYFAVRLVIALTVAMAALALVNRWEHCRNDHRPAACLWRDAGGIITVGNLEALSIVTASILFVLEGGRRRQRDQIEAMELILNTQQAGIRRSDARDQALELLSHAGIWLDGIDLRGAILDQLQVPGSRWRRAQLSSASLCQADLHHCEWQDADLQQANLQGANLRRADLRGADLRGADLRGCDLRDTDLRGADLTGTSVDGARMDGALLDGPPMDGLPTDGLPSDDDSMDRRS